MNRGVRMKKECVDICKICLEAAIVDENNVCIHCINETK